MANRQRRAKQLERNTAAGQARIAATLRSHQRAIAGTIDEFVTRRAFLTNASVRTQLYKELSAEYMKLNSSVNEWARSEVKITSKNFFEYAKEDTPSGAIGPFGAFSKKYVEDIVGLINPATMPGQVAVNAQVGGMLAENVRHLRAAVSTTLAEGAVEGLTNRQMAARMMDKVSGFKEKFVFVDRAGRKWNTDTYFGMLNRTLHATAARESYISAATKEAGFDLYVIAGGVTGSSQENPDDPCDDWAGRVFSMTGNTKGYPTYADVIAAGVFHPNCVHFVRVADEDEILSGGK